MKESDNVRRNVDSRDHRRPGVSKCAPDEATVSRYAEDVEQLPPVEVWRENGSTYLVDGRHRIEAHKKRKIEAIQVIYFAGSRAEVEARARSANLTHALPLTAAQRSQARCDILERLYEYNNLWLAQDYMHCSKNTVAALREKLEEAERIPKLDQFLCRDGSTTPRTKERVVDEEPDDGLFGEARDIQPPADLLEPEQEPDNDDGGYNVEEDELEAEVAPSARKGGGVMDEPPSDVDYGEGMAKARNAAVKLAQLGDPYAVEVVMYIDDEPHAIPVTMLIAEGAVAGVEEAAPGHSNVLVVGREIAERLMLWP
jgi:hypothetical protein